MNSNIVTHLAELNHLIANREPIAKIADFLSQPEVYAVLPALAQMSGMVTSLLTLHCAQEWPEEKAGLLADLVAAIPYQFPELEMPCGARELFLLKAFRSGKVPLAIKKHLLGKIISGEYCLPRYEAGQTWTVPEKLLDHPALRRWFVLTKQPGWEDLQNSDALFFKGTLPLNRENPETRNALKAIENDSVAALLLPFSIAGKNMPVKYFLAALWKGAVKIVLHLYSEMPAIQKAMPHRELLLYVCANWDGAKAIPVIEMLEKKQPGIVAKTRDFRSCDALWYTLYNHETSASLIETLIRYGCNHNRKQVGGLSYEEMTTKS